MYVNDKQSVIEMFVDRTAGESTQANRLITRETENGTIALIAYGWVKVAEYDEERGVVTIFVGHRALESDTVNGYLNDVKEVAQERGRDYSISGESPEWGQPPSIVEYIGNYINFRSPESSVERDARNDVIETLKPLA